jgi:hypothetical protein
MNFQIAPQMLPWLTERDNGNHKYIVLPFKLVPNKRDIMRITIINDVYFRKCYYFNVLKSELASFPRTGAGHLQPCKVKSSHSSAGEDWSLVGYDDIYVGKQLPTFRASLFAPYCRSDSVFTTYAFEFFTV